jgi:hypothetical protein
MRFIGKPLTKDSNVRPLKRKVGYDDKDEDVRETRRAVAYMNLDHESGNT